MSESKVTARLREAGEWVEAHTRDSWTIVLFIVPQGVFIQVVWVPPEGSDQEEHISMQHGVTWPELEDGQENYLLQHCKNMYKQAKAEVYRRMYGGGQIIPTTDG